MEIDPAMLPSPLITPVMGRFSVFIDFRSARLFLIDLQIPA